MTTYYSRDRNIYKKEKGNIFLLIYTGYHYDWANTTSTAWLVTESPPLTLEDLVDLINEEWPADGSLKNDKIQFLMREI